MAKLKPIKRDGDGNIIVPRLSANSGLLGPEYAGCCGTGQRPKILHCGYSKRYIVGREYDVSQARVKIMATPNKRVFGKGRERVLAFKGRKAAVVEFNRLCREVQAFNDETRAAIERDRAAARTGDIAATLRLGLDY